MLVKSLQEVGAARSIVIDENGTILAGNGTVEAAAEAGITKMKVVEADGETIIAVQRTGLSQKAKERLALYDNRVAELAEWDVEMLHTYEGESLQGLWNPKELDKLFGEKTAIDITPPTVLEYRIIIDCTSEAEQSALLERFENEGLKCKALIS